MINALEVIINNEVLDLAGIFTCFCLSKTIRDALVNSDDIKTFLKRIAERRGLSLSYQVDESWMNVISTCRSFRRIDKSPPAILMTTFTTELISCHIQVYYICMYTDTNIKRIF